MSLYFPTTDEQSRHTIFPGVTIRTCAAEHMMMSFVEFDPRAVVEEHAHPHEQVGMILTGLAGGASRSLRIDTQGKTFALALLEMAVELPESYRAMLRPAAEDEP